MESTNTANSRNWSCIKSIITIIYIRLAFLSMFLCSCSQWIFLCALCILHLNPVQLDDKTQRKKFITHREAVKTNPEEWSANQMFRGNQQIKYMFRLSTINVSHWMKFRWICFNQEDSHFIDIISLCFHTFLFVSYEIIEQGHWVWRG